MYATVNDMIDRFGEVQILRLSNPEDRTAETVDTVRVTTALMDATALVDSYVRGRYATPIATPPRDIVRATCALAIYDLATSERASPSEDMRKNREETIRWLEKIAAEQVRIDAPLAEAAGGNAVGTGPRISDRERIMTRDSLRGF